MVWLADDGFEHGMTPPPWDVNNSGAPATSLGVDGTNPGSGDYAIRAVFGSNDGVRVDELFNYSRASIAVAMNLGLSFRVDSWADLAELQLYLAIDGAQDSFLILDFDPNGDIRIGTDLNDSIASGFVVLDTAAGVCGVDGELYDVELRWIQDSTVGVVEVAINGTVVSGLSNVDSSAGSGSSNSFGWGVIAASTNPGALVIDFDDFRIGTDQALQGVKVHPPLLSPTSTTTGDGVGSDADSVDNHLLVDDVPLDNDTATYVDHTTVAERDLYGMSNAADDGTAIDTVSVWAVVSNPTGSGTVDAVIESNGFEYSEESGPLTSTAELQRIGYTAVDPDGDVAWTFAKLNAAEAGIEAATLA